MIPCPDCSKEVSPSSISCPNCGHSFQVIRRGPVGKAMKYIFIWFNLVLFLYVVWTIALGGAMASEGSEGSEMAGGLVALFGIGSAVFVWFGGALFWALLVYMTKGRYRVPLTSGEKKRDRFIFWGGTIAITLYFIVLMTMTISAGNQFAAERKNTFGWKELSVMDDFGDAIEGKTAIAGLFPGKFDNVLTEDEELEVRLRVVDSQIWTSLFEYGLEGTELPNNEFVNTNIKKPDGETISIEQFIYDNSITDTKGELYNLLLSEEGVYKFVIDLNEVNEFLTNVYRYSVDTRGLSELLGLNQNEKDMPMVTANDEAPSEPSEVESTNQEKKKGNLVSERKTEAIVNSSNVKTEIPEEAKKEEVQSEVQLGSSHPEYPVRFIQFVAGAKGKSFPQLQELGEVVTEQVPGKNIYRYKIKGRFNDDQVKEVIRELSRAGYPGAFETK